MCYVNHHKLLVSGLTAVNEVRKRIVYILDEIIVFFYRRLGDNNSIRKTLFQLGAESGAGGTQVIPSSPVPQSMQSAGFGSSSS